MKFTLLTSPLARSIFALSIAATMTSLSTPAALAQMYWDTNGSSIGATDTGVANGTWGIDSFWTTSEPGTAVTGAYVSGSSVIFSAGSNTTSAVIVVDGTQTVAVATNGIQLRGGSYTFNGGVLQIAQGGANAALIRNSSSGSSTINSAITITDATTTSAENYSIQNDASAGNLTIAGDITFSLSGAPAAIKTINLGNASATSTLTFSGKIANAPGGTATSTINVASSANEGKVLITGDNSALSAAQTGGVTRGVALLGNAKAFGNGGINIGNSGTGAGTAHLLTNGAFTIANGITLGGAAAGANVAVGGNTADVSTYSGTVNLNGNVVNTFRVTSVAGGKVNFTGIISGNTSTANLEKEGDGIVVFTRANTYNRNTLVSTGTLLINNTTGSGTSNTKVTVSSGATLGGTGIIGGTANATSDVVVEGILAPGDISDLGVAQIGTLTIGSSGVSRSTFLSEGSTLSIQTGLNTSDRLVMFGNFDLSGNQTLALSGTLDGVNNYVVATFTGALTGTFENVTGLSPNYVVQYNLNSITLTVVPEPSTVALALIGVAGLFVVYRRNRRVNA